MLHARPNLIPGLHGMGVLPVVVPIAAGGAAYAVGSETGAYLYRQATNWWDPVAQWLGLRPAPVMPVNPAKPQFSGPSAPQTRGMMTSPTAWGDLGKAEADAQIRRQQAINEDYQRIIANDLLRAGDPNTVSAQDLTGGDGNLLWIIGGVVVVVGLLIVAKRK